MTPIRVIFDITVSHHRHTHENQHPQLQNPCVLDKTVGHNGVDVLDSFVCDQVVRPTTNAMSKLQPTIHCALLLCGFVIHGEDKVKDPFGPIAPVKPTEAKVEAPRPSPRSLKHFGEPSLVQLTDAATRPAIRFVWIRTFHAPISIRAYLTADGPRLRVARMSGQGGYEWGTLDFENDYPLSKSHWERLTTLINVDYARQPLRDVKPENRDMLDGLDGASWILEVADSKGYTTADVSNPTTVSQMKEEERRQIESLGFHIEPFVAACKYLIQFAPMDADNIY